MYCIALPAWQRRTLLHAAVALALPPAGVAQTAEVQSHQSRHDTRARFRRGKPAGIDAARNPDVRLRYRAIKQWVASVGIDNLGNATYWAFHPYPQRTFMAELRYDH